MILRRLAATLAIVTLVGACSSGATSSPSTAPASAAAGSPAPSSAASPAPSTAGKVTITWWNNANTDPGKTFNQTVVDEYMAAHPNVTIKISAMQNEDFKTKLPLALNSSTPPDIFASWGGGGLRQQVEAGKVKDLTADMASWANTINVGALGLWQVDGKQYGIPFTLGLVGFWYNKDFFTKAGVTTPPATWDDFLADVPKIKATGVAPISLGEKDAWTGAFWWEYLALRECGKDKMGAAVKNNSFEDPCFVKAGEDLKTLIDLKPFNDGFLGTPAQTGATSAAGLLANGKTSMELMGQWEPGVMGPLTPDGKGLGDKLGWFPFPTVSGGAGAITEGIGGGDGYAISVNAPPEALDFLKYYVSVDVMKRRGALNDGTLPTTIGAESSVTDPNLKDLLAKRSEATFVQLYLDQAFSAQVGQAINDAVAGQFSGSLKAAEVQAAVQAATKK